jgi:hypothetical protein
LEIAGETKEDVSNGEENTTKIEEEFVDAPPLRPLTSIRWPYIPEQPAYPDPLKRDDPKPLVEKQYEAIGAPCVILQSIPC